MPKIEVAGLTIERNGFGALPIQRISKDDAVYLVRKAYDNGMDYFDTARSYTDSEEKLCAALKGMRDKVIIASKTMSRDTEAFWKHLHTSLTNLGTDYIDIYQFHNPPLCPVPGGADGLYDAMLKAKEQGKIRVISITSHRLDVATEAVNSGLYETLMFPFSYISGTQELELAQACHERSIAFFAMKALAGGLITNSAAASAWINQHDGVIPLWGIQHEWELDEFSAYIKNPPVLTPELNAVIEADRADLSGDFCRGCGYCMPCPQDIEINTCARASLFLRRAPLGTIMSDEGRAKMEKIPDCGECGECSAKCPYGLDTPALLRKNYADFKRVEASLKLR